MIKRTREIPSGRMVYEIITPHARLVRGECDFLAAPAIHGEVGFLVNHAPYMAALATGVLRARSDVTGGEERYFVSGGFIEVLDNEITVLAELAEKAEEIDLDRAREAQSQAKKRLEDVSGDQQDRLRARARYQRAIARLKAAGQQPS